MTAPLSRARLVSDASFIREVAGMVCRDQPAAAARLEDIAADLVGNDVAWRELTQTLLGEGADDDRLTDLFDDAPWWNWDYERPADPPPRPLLAGFSS